MLYSDTGWVDYETDNEIINLYLNLRNMYRYIKHNKQDLKYIDDKAPFRLFHHDEQPIKGYIDFNGIFELDKFSYNYRKVLDRFKSNNINDITTFFKLVDDLSDFLLFLDHINTISRYNIDIKVLITKEDKKVIVIKVNNTPVTITIEQTAIENVRRSGSILLDLLDTKESDKYITFYTLNINNIDYKFITGEDPKLTLEEKIVISDTIDNLLVRMLNQVKDCLLYDISSIFLASVNRYTSVDILNYSLIDGKISYKYS